VAVIAEGSAVKRPFKLAERINDMKGVFSDKGREVIWHGFLP
jgi:hypothetical protein